MSAPPTFPDDFNLADYFLFDRLAEGLGDKDGDPLRRAPLHLRRRSPPACAPWPSFFASAGVAREERVLIVLHDTPAFAWAFFATLHHGAVVAMGNPEAPPGDLAYLVEYTRATVVITIPRVAAAIQPALAAAGLQRARSLARGRHRRRRRGRARVRPPSPTSPPVSLRDALAAGSTRAPPSADPARRHRHLALHLGVHRAEQGGHAHPPRLRLQHRGLRQAHRRLPRAATSRSRCRASSSATPPAPT